MSESSTERVRQFRDRQAAAGRKRITLYFDSEAQDKLDQLAGGEAQAPILERLVRMAVKRELNAIASCPKDSEPRPAVSNRNPLAFPGRRRSLPDG